MMINNVKKMIEENNGKSVLFVLKGFAPEQFGYARANLADTIEDKMSRLMALAMEEEKVIAFDEFAALYELAVSLYKRIVIIENPLYMNLYPAGAELPENIRQALLVHYDDDLSSESDLGDIDDYVAVYSNFIETENGIACCYNLDDSALKHEKILVMDAMDIQAAAPVLSEDAKSFVRVNICTDIDYYELLGKLMDTADIFAVNYNSYAGGTQVMGRAVARLNGYFSGRIVAGMDGGSSAEPAFHYPEITEMMEKYWGYPEYRNIRMYDINAVNKGVKKVISVSQENIISDLVSQVEKCRLGQASRDVFVTAPTGAGKSLMFQLPAMYLAEKYGLLTIVITPLIGLMNDQVQALEAKGYHGARTINSDISPIIRDEILNEVAEGICNILYLSPESLLSRSDITALIGSRRIGMLVVDEAHIVTTWGKQFRPDYWYLGDHVHKLRTAQSKAPENPMSFVIATFTATAIYKGTEDMYNETLNSLHMIDPITYLGYVKRDNISIEVSEIEAVHNRTEYELDKFDSLIKMINTAMVRGQKTLIYFPTVALIERFFTYCYSKNLRDYVTKYHGQMTADNKNASFRDFLTGAKSVMLATKAFGMGIDIPDIAIVSHYAPTGNVCDYMQEIGRAARDIHIDGHAVYEHMSTDFQHINRLHGLSSVYKGQLVEVIKKILELYEAYRYEGTGANHMKKRNEMLIDTESFSYIFDGPMSDESTLVNKVKTAMLLIQKDYENRGFTPFRMRPIPIFAYGYLTIRPDFREKIAGRYPKAVQVVNSRLHVCRVDLRSIWEKDYQHKMSFPKFKYMLYSGSDELEFNQQYRFSTAMSIDVIFEKNCETDFVRIFQGLKDTLNESVRTNTFNSEEDLVQLLMKDSGIGQYKAENIIRVILAAVNTYSREYSKGIYAKLVSVHPLKNGKVKYKFESPIRNFFFWIQEGWNTVVEETYEGCMYVTNEGDSVRTREIITVLGILESFGILHFKSLGGTNSQIYIYVNETKTMRMVREKPELYKNRLLESIGDRHAESVKMLNYLFQSGFSSDEIWEHLENYFLGIDQGTL